MTTQMLFNVLIAIVLGGGSWWFKNIWQELKEVKSDIKDMDKDRADIKLNLAENYHKKEEVTEMFKTLVDKLDGLADLRLLLAEKYVTKEDQANRDAKLQGTLDKIERAVRNRSSR
jgi:hypothetical protein